MGRQLAVVRVSTSEAFQDSWFTLRQAIAPGIVEARVRSLGDDPRRYAVGRPRTRTFFHVRGSPAELLPAGSADQSAAD